jgi:hypothetical protein
MISIVSASQDNSTILLATKHDLIFQLRLSVSIQSLLLCWML